MLTIDDLRKIEANEVLWGRNLSFLFKKIFADYDYKYFDTPEGEDCIKKMKYFVHVSAPIIGLVAFRHVLLYKRPEHVSQFIGRVLRIAFPSVLSAATFPSTVCIATNYRKKDDVYNYGLGGLAVGAIYAAAFKSFHTAVYGAPLLGLACMIVKDGIEKDFLYNVKRIQPYEYFPNGP